MGFNGYACIFFNCSVHPNRFPHKLTTEEVNTSYRYELSACDSMQKACACSGQIESQPGGEGEEYVPPVAEELLKIVSCWERRFSLRV